MAARILIGATTGVCAARFAIHQATGVHTTKVRVAMLSIIRADAGIACIGAANARSGSEIIVKNRRMRGFASFAATSAATPAGTAARAAPSPPATTVALTPAAMVETSTGCAWVPAMFASTLFALALVWFVMSVSALVGVATAGETSGTFAELASNAASSFASGFASGFG